MDESSAPQSNLLGRSRERQILAGLLQAARDGQGGAIVLRGEAGIGKSALLDDMVKGAGKYLVGRVVGVQSEAEFPYSCLQQLCGPSMEGLPNLPSLHRNTLCNAFGLGFGPPPDRYLVGMAVLELLGLAAQEKPVIWIVDDAQWLDAESRHAIGFVGRRLREQHAIVLVATRDEVEEGNELAGFQELHLAGLVTHHAGLLFDSVVTGPLDQTVRDRIIAETRGNPRAFLELPKAWTTAELVEGLSESTSGSVAGKLEQEFAKRIRELPSDAQTFLTLAASETQGDAAILHAAAELLKLDWTAAAPAECAGLIDLGPRVRFRHPLARAAAYRAAPLQTRLEVHGALAKVTDPVHDPDRRVWHRANSTVVHHEEIGVELERSAGRARARGGFLAAAAFLERAALLTSNDGQRADRTLAAATAKRDAGALEAALRLLPAVSTRPPTEIRGALAERLRGRIVFDQRRSTLAAELLLNAAQTLERFDPIIARDTYLEAVLAAVWANGPEGGEFVNKTAEGAGIALAEAGELSRVSDMLLAALALRVTEGHEAAAAMMCRALTAVRDHDVDADAVDPLLWMTKTRAAGIIATEAWDYEGGRRLAERQVGAARDAGALVQLQFALNFLANNLVLAGDLRGASALVQEEQALSTMTHVASVGQTEMLLEAYRGNVAAASTLISTSRDAALVEGQGRLVALAHYASAVLDNGRGRHAEALASARRVVEWDVLGYQTLAASELAEAASRAGDTTLLAHVRAWVSARAAATPTHWALGMAARVQAFDAEGATADALYRSSIEHLERTRLGVDLARSHLLYGEWLRRTGSRGDARQQLSIALESLNKMGVCGFAERAHRELSAATNRRMRRYLDSPEIRLTSQEMRIAQLVQQGLTNPEIGTRLFLSPRTIEWHLRNVFGKFGISSRRELRGMSLSTELPSRMDAAF
jgi:DNA-binding CsgD family transcriptional regulator